MRLTGETMKLAPLFLVPLAVLLGACAGTGTAPREVAAPPVTSTAQADQQLALVARERAAIEARYAETERVCYIKFFVNNCLDEAKERRRSALAAQRAIEVQAEHFKRQAIVDERDRQMAEAEKRFQEQEARMAQEAAARPPRDVTPEPPPKPSTVTDRKAEHNARVRAQAKQDAQEADKRAQNVRDFEARKAESEERQRRVAERKAEKAEKAAKAAPKPDGAAANKPAADTPVR
jgi:hypothetical protein